MPPLFVEEDMRKVERQLLGQKKAAFTLVELLVATAVMLVAVAGILMSYLRCMELNEISRNSAVAVQAASSRMERIKAAPFNQIWANYHNVAFDVPGLNGRGVSYVDASDPELLEVNVAVCWVQKNGRGFGEDSNANGQLDAGEDDNGNGYLDSTVEMTNLVFQR